MMNQYVLLYIDDIPFMIDMIESYDTVILCEWGGEVLNTHRWGKVFNTHVHY